MALSLRLNVKHKTSRVDHAGIDLDLRLASLFARYQAGDASATNQFAEQLQPILIRHFFLRTGDRMLAEDLAQECWIRVHRARASFRPGEPVMPWVYAIARNTRIDHHRRETARRHVSEPATWAEPTHDERPALEGRMMAARILDQLGQLPESQREVFLLLKVQGLSVEETARAVGISPSAAKQKAYRAYESIRAILGFHKEEGRL